VIQACLIAFNNTNKNILCYENIIHFSISLNLNMALELIASLCYLKTVRRKQCTCKT